ncbi:hypothetical protein JKP88DRAFT_255045 [Tribonema minus]|uniref:Uncharacterized protein n=1 Tax=Tribonema minus TaxID=303371 RepID=A0A835Z3Y5_9STRA|nr:hypothetical protein JKP88DRAFT_255045 [Tribonema minus]
MGLCAPPSAGSKLHVEPLDAFSHALAHAAPDTDGILSLPHANCLRGGPDLSSKLYVRQSYVELFDRLLDMTVHKPWRRDWWKRHAIVTGTPGIGTSRFALYCLWRLRAAGETVLYQRGPYIYRFGSDGTAAEYASSYRLCNEVATWQHEHLLLDDAEGHNAWVQVDGIIWRDGTRRRHDKPFIRHYRQFQYEREENMRYLSPWTLDELQHCRTHIHGDFTPQHVRDWYGVKGGLPGAVFNATTNLDPVDSKIELPSSMSPQTALPITLDAAALRREDAELDGVVDWCVRETGLHMAWHMAGEQQTGYSAEEQARARRVLHMFARLDYRRYEAYFASDRVRAKVAARVEHQHSEAVAELVHDIYVWPRKGPLQLAGEMWSLEVQRQLSAGVSLRYMTIIFPDDMATPQIHVLKFIPRARRASPPWPTSPA